MADSPPSQAFIKRSVWLGIGVGWLAQLALKTVLPLAVLVGVRLLSLEIENKALWLENPDDSSHPVWYALQAAVFIGSALAGALAAMLSPRKSIAIVPITLVVLSLVATGFEQLPRPMSITVLSIWAAGPCVGLVVGWLLVRLLPRGAA